MGFGAAKTVRLRQRKIMCNEVTRIGIIIDITTDTNKSLHTAMSFI